VRNQEKDILSDNSIIYLPDAPTMPGLTFRRFRGAADYAPMAAVREGSREWDDVVTAVDTLLVQFVAGLSLRHY